MGSSITECNHYIGIEPSVLVYTALPRLCSFVLSWWCLGTSFACIHTHTLFLKEVHGPDIEAHWFELPVQMPTSHITDPRFLPLFLLRPPANMPQKQPKHLGSFHLQGNSESVAPVFSLAQPSSLLPGCIELLYLATNIQEIMKLCWFPESSCRYHQEMRSQLKVVLNYKSLLTQ